MEHGFVSFCLLACSRIDGGPWSGRALRCGGEFFRKDLGILERILLEQGQRLVDVRRDADPSSVNPGEDEPRVGECLLARALKYSKILRSCGASWPSAPLV